MKRVDYSHISEIRIALFHCNICQQWKITHWLAPICKNSVNFKQHSPLKPITTDVESWQPWGSFEFVIQSHVTRICGIEIKLLRIAPWINNPSVGAEGLFEGRKTHSKLNPALPKQKAFFGWNGLRTWPSRNPPQHQSTQANKVKLKRLLAEKAAPMWLKLTGLPISSQK